ncbi:cytochrome P450 2L1 [Procambarus clarkii]|uniref:cytochrome P450 2L1 n=1 Tax=Procambarus clarkii TaxID=6728 RepID=UPI001E677F52|nr:cytochrome P450 2L1-like [Procambarus clarkii]XP_045612489.1 cytochrome P450 2L1-like [Procambarus clarkii]
MLVEAVVCVALALLLWHYFKVPAGMPPGRWGLPLIGYIPVTMKSLSEHLSYMHKQYGDIYVWRMGTQVVVVLHDYLLVKEAHNRTEDFVDRPNWKLLNLGSTKEVGVIGSNGFVWQKNRRFTLRLLRDMGMGKSLLVEAIQHQASSLVEQLKKQANRPAPVPHALHVAVVNVIWQMVNGKQFEHHDPRLEKFQELTKDLLKASFRLGLTDLMPWLEKVLPRTFARSFFRRDLLEDMKIRFTKYFNTLIEEHRTTLDVNNPRDLIDGYLIEIDKRKDEPDDSFNEYDLSLLLVDLFLAGSETTTTSMTWLFCYLANYPEVQNKLQAEIDQVLPQGTLATLDDKLRMPYTEAVIHEVLRKSSLIAFGVQHLATRDTTLGTYTIPKGTVLSTAQEYIHHDPRYWDRPEQFLPERWLDQDGKFVAKKEGFLPFGVGKRSCLGEGLARMELFIFTTTVFQSLSFSAPLNKTVDLHYDREVFFTHAPKTQDLLVTIRPTF